MGAEARTTVRIGESWYAGTALLETDELIFRGETRLRIGLADIRAASAAGLTYTKVVRFSETDTAERLVIPRAAR